MSVEAATVGTPTPDSADMGARWTEDEVLRVLWRHFGAQSWAPIPQVTVAARDSDPHSADVTSVEAFLASVDRRIDMLMIRPAKRQGIGPLETLAIEVKVTRADFLNDVRNPEKQAPWRKAATRHAYAVPAGLVHRDEIPEGSGLIAVKRGWSDAVEWVIRAPYPKEHAPELPRRVLVALAHRLSRLEGVTRGWDTSPAAAGDEQEVRAALKAAQKEAERLGRALKRESGKTEAWRTAHALSNPAGHPCRWCKQPVKPINPTGGWFKKWRHVNGDHDEACREAEAQVRENEALDAYDAATEEERAAALRRAHTWGFTDLIEREPWRAFLPYRHARRGEAGQTGPEPADVLPEGEGAA